MGDRFGYKLDWALDYVIQQDCILDTFLTYESIPSRDEVMQYYQANPDKFAEPKLKCVYVMGYSVFNAQLKEVGLDPNYHFQFLTVHNDAEMTQMRYSLSNQKLDRAYPLWRFYFIANENGNPAILMRISHLITDGIRAINWYENICTFKDGSVCKNEIIGKMMSNRSKAKPNVSKILKNAVPDLIEVLAQSSVKYDDKLSVTSPGQWYPDDGRHFMESVTLNIDKIKAIKNRYTDCTLNDVLYTMVGQTLIKLHKEDNPEFKDWGSLNVHSILAFGMPTKKAFITESNKLPMYNDILLNRTPIYMKSTNLKTAITETHKTMDAYKHSLKPIFTAKLLNTLAYLGLDIVLKDGIKSNYKANSIVFSNLPGMTQDTFLLGKHRMLTCNSYFKNVLSQLIFYSYKDEIFCNLTTHQDYFKQPQRFLDYMKELQDKWFEEKEQYDSL